MWCDRTIFGEEIVSIFTENTIVTKLTFLYHNTDAPMPNILPKLITLNVPVKGR